MHARTLLAKNFTQRDVLFVIVAHYHHCTQMVKQLKLQINGGDDDDDCEKRV